jgi:hypothetical protein
MSIFLDKKTHLRGEEIPSVNPIVFGVVRLTQRAVDEQGVQRHHRGEDEVVQHNAHQVQVLHLKYLIKLQHQHTRGPVPF